MTSFATTDRSLDRYVSEINAYPVLSRADEVGLAEAYRAGTNFQAAHRLIVSNLRFVVKVAHEYRGYGLKLLDLIQEGNIGLMMAVKKFEPAKGYRLISYAVWWIRAYIQNFILRSWSLVKLGTTQAQRKLFFKLRSERERADRAAGPGMSASSHELAERLQVEEREIIDMEMRLAARDFSLDAEVQDGSRLTHVDLLVGEQGGTVEDTYAEDEAKQLLRHRVARGHGTPQREGVLHHRPPPHDRRAQDPAGDRPLLQHLARAGAPDRVQRHPQDPAGARGHRFERQFRGGSGLRAGPEGPDRLLGDAGGAPLRLGRVGVVARLEQIGVAWVVHRHEGEAPGRRGDADGPTVAGLQHRLHVGDAAAALATSSRVPARMRHMCRQ